MMRDVKTHSLEKSKNIRNVTTKARPYVVNDLWLHELWQGTDEIA